MCLGQNRSKKPKRILGGKGLLGQDEVEEDSTEMEDGTASLKVDLYIGATLVRVVEVF